jgi:hypothetical protein
MPSHRSDVSCNRPASAVGAELKAHFLPLTKKPLVTIGFAQREKISVPLSVRTKPYPSRRGLKLLIVPVSILTSWSAGEGFQKAAAVVGAGAGLPSEDESETRPRHSKASCPRIGNHQLGGPDG